MLGGSGGTFGPLPALVWEHAQLAAVAAAVQVKTMDAQEQPRTDWYPPDLGKAILAPWMQSSETEPLVVASVHFECLHHGETTLPRALSRATQSRQATNE